MENIIEKIYNLHLNHDSISLDEIDHESSLHEYELYCKIYTNLSEEMKESFHEFLSIRNNRQKESLKLSYQTGFKTAIKLIIEATKE